MVQILLVQILEPVRKVFKIETITDLRDVELKLDLFLLAVFPTYGPIDLLDVNVAFSPTAEPFCLSPGLSPPAHATTTGTR